jgi:hypothetical protein
MFRDRPRRSPPFADFINWTDYRWDNTPWQGAATRPGPSGRTHPYQRRFSFLQVLLAGLAVVVGIRLMSSLRSSVNRSWLEKAVFGVMLLGIASYVSKRRRF